MENMKPQMSRSEKLTPQFFAASIWVSAKKILEQMKENAREIKEAFIEMPSGMKEVRKGNFSDELRVRLRAESFAAKQYLEELSSVGNVSKEEYHRLQGLAKLVEFYEAQENYFARLVETKDDPDLTELSLVMWAEMQKNYAECMKEFPGDSQAE